MSTHSNQKPQHKQKKAIWHDLKDYVKKKSKDVWANKDFRRFLIKAGILVFIILLIWIFKKQIISYIRSIPYIGPAYEHVALQITQKTLLGLFYAAFLGGLFFVTLPVEAVFIFYLTLKYNVYFVVLIAFLGNLLAMILNYLLGLLFGKWLLKKVLKHNHDRFNNWVKRFGGLILVIGNIIPFPIEPLALVYGGVKYPFKKFVILTAIGKLIKFIILAVIFFYFLDQLPWLKNILN